jgi:two-component system response regulator AdeR
MNHRHSVLLVEDDASIRDALAELLNENGVRTWRACDGREAIQRLRSRKAPPCLVLLDLMMSGMNGWEFLEVHRGDKKLSSIPLVLVTAWVETDLGQAKAMVSKPIDPPKLLRTVRKILNQENGGRPARPRRAARTAERRQASRGASRRKASGSKELRSAARS